MKPSSKSFAPSPRSHISKTLINARVRQELTQLLFARSITPNLFVIIGSLVIIFLLRSQVPTQYLLAWFALMSFLSICRIAVYLLFKHYGNSPKRINRLVTLYLIFTGLVGISWSLLACLPNIMTNLNAAIFVTFIMVGTIFIASTALCMNQLALVLYISPFPLMLFFRMFNSPLPGFDRYAIMIMVFWPFTLWISQQQHRALVNSLILQCTNEELINQLESAVKNEKKANKSKSDFLANMSHEIRTPMNSIIGRTRLALEDDLNPEMRSHLKMISNSSENLLSLINDILDFSKIEAGELKVDKRPFDLQATIKGCIKTVSVILENRTNKVVLSSTLAPDLPHSIIGDPLRLRQILLNLLSNSIKFTEQGSISLLVDCHNGKDDALNLRFQLQDTGIGIAAENLEHIFNKFAQEDTSSTRKFSGTGLGLAICRQLCQLMGGDIQVTSTLGKGSTFTFTIPVHICDPADLPKQQPQVLDNQKALPPLNILLVEDNPANLVLARMILKKNNHSIIEANDGLEALEILASNKNRFDVILMDVQMPEMDGLTTTRIIRAAEMGAPVKGINNTLATKLSRVLGGTHLPIIAVTANAMSDDNKECLAAGMDDYLTKPFIPENFTAVFGKLAANYYRS